MIGGSKLFGTSMKAEYDAGKTAQEREYYSRKATELDRLITEIESGQVDINFQAVLAKLNLPGLPHIWSWPGIREEREADDIVKAILASVQSRT